MPTPSHPHFVLTYSFPSILFQSQFHPSGFVSATQYIVSDGQPENAYLPIEVTPSGITTLVSDVHPANAYWPMEKTLLLKLNPLPLKE